MHENAAGCGDVELELRAGTRLRASRRYRESRQEALDGLAVRPTGAAARPSERNREPGLP
jgi:hypothetical protein